MKNSRENKKLKGNCNTGLIFEKITIMELLNINCKCYNYWENKRKGVYMCVLGKMYGYKEVKSSLS